MTEYQLKNLFENRYNQVGISKGDEYVYYSIFKNEKTASMYVNYNKACFKDFSTGMGGSLYILLKEDIPNKNITYPNKI